jgi:hypothetical protein
MRIFFTLIILIGCTRPTAEYPVQVHSNGTSLADIEKAPTPMGGLIEYARLRLYGSNLGQGLTGLYGDIPRADGQEFLLGAASFAYPPHASFDNVSTLLNSGSTTEDNCQTIIGPRSYPGSTEYIDVGDQVRLSADGVQAILARDPVIYPRPAGESWFVGYGSTLTPSLIDYEAGLDNWKSGTTLDISFPGGLPPQYATVGAIPYPLINASMTLPTQLSDVMVNGEAVRAPQHGEEDDPVRFAGPWAEAMEITWTPSDPPQPLTIAIRTVGSVSEGDCSCDEDCGSGFSCQEAECFGDDGSSSEQLGELLCTVTDDGTFSISPADVEQLQNNTKEKLAGSILIVSRITEGEITTPDVLSFNGKRIENGTVRTRAIDAIYTRLEIAQ